MRLLSKLLAGVDLFDVEVFGGESFKAKIGLATAANDGIIFVVVYFSLADISRLECDQVWLPHDVRD